MRHLGRLRAIDDLDRFLDEAAITLIPVRIALIRRAARNAKVFNPRSLAGTRRDIPHFRKAGKTPWRKFGCRCSCSPRMRRRRLNPQDSCEYFLPYQCVAIPIHSMGPDGLLLEVNEAWVDYTGYSRNEALGRSFADFRDPTSATLYGQDAVPELINTVPANESRSVEYRLLNSSGTLWRLSLPHVRSAIPIPGGSFIASQ